MPFVELRALLPDLARRETRGLVKYDENGQVQDGLYFIEAFCNEPGCDCRRVVFQVYDAHDPSGPIATLSYGWESEEFYRRWASFPLEPEDLEELRGPALMRLTPQSDRAEEALTALQTLLESEPYAKRIVEHYNAFRALIGAPARKRGWVSPSRKNKSRSKAR